MMLHNAYGYGLFTGGLGLHGGGERLGLTVVPVSGGMTERQLTLIEDLRPEVIACTPATRSRSRTLSLSLSLSLLLIATFTCIVLGPYHCKKVGKTNPNPVRDVVGADKVTSVSASCKWPTTRYQLISISSFPRFILFDRTSARRNRNGVAGQRADRTSTPCQCTPFVPVEPLHAGEDLTEGGDIQGACFRDTRLRRFSSVERLPIQVPNRLASIFVTGITTIFAGADAGER